MSLQSFAMGSDSFEFARIAEHPKKGKVLVATRALSPGLTVLHEAPLLLLPLHSSNAESYHAFLAAPAAVQSQVREFWCPVDGPSAVDLRASALADPSFTGDVETLVMVNKVFTRNGLEAHGPDGQRFGSKGLYVTAGRASHSCNPNCHWFTDEKGWITVRTVVPVEQGQELTIAYTYGRLGRFKYQSVCKRQDELFAGREFSCDCPRCNAYGDDMRVFPCASPACSGHHLVHQPSSKHSPEFTPCSSCTSRLSTAAAAAYLAQETKLDELLDRIEAAEAAEDEDSFVHNFEHAQLAPRILRLRPPHPRHAAAARIAWLQHPLFAASEEWGKAVAALEAVIRCESAVVPCSQYTPHDKMGDTILEMPRLTVQHIRRAEQAYRRTLQLVMAARGSAGHDTELSSKLADTQARLPDEDIAALASLTACSFCGGGGFDGMPLTRCERCHAAAYCCQEHRHAQWPLHKRHCKPQA